MRAPLLAALLALASGAACAQATGRLHASRDSDDFRERIATLGYAGASGFGLKAGTAEYDAPGWSVDGASLAATYRRDDERRQVDASLGALRVDGRTRAVGALDWLQKDVGWRSSLGLSTERDIVDSQRGIEDGLTSDSLALVGDHAFGDRFNVGAAAGVTWFSDGNRRPFLRTRWNLLLDDDFGLNAYLKTRHYRNSQPDRPDYYSPERLGEVSLGLSTRFLVAERVVLAAQADAGQQRTPGDTKSIWSYTVGVGAPRRSRVQWSVALQATNTAAAAANASGAYRYTSLLAQLRVPF